MKTILTLTTLVALTTAGAAFSQTTQRGVLGPSDNAAYPVRVAGSDGVTYICKDTVKVVDGVARRECIREPGEAAGTLFGAGSGLGEGGAIAAGVIGLVVLGAAGGSDGAATTTTTGGSAAVLSDARLKSDITQVGTTAHGLALYEFRYTGGDQTFRGVMAQDVQRVMPEAVVTLDNGYMAVRYDMLGIEMTKVR